MEVVNKKLVLVVIMIGIVSSIFIWQNISVKETELEIVSLNNETKSSSMFAIMLEEIDEEGNLTYVESSDNMWPSLKYKYNSTNSGCLDVNGTSIPDILSYDSKNQKAIVRTKKVAYCYLYFDIDESVYAKVRNDYTDNNGALLLSETESDEYPVYYYNGDITNNNILYANFCWKMVRTTETGGVKLIYNGVPDEAEDGTLTCDNTGEETEIGKSEFNSSGGTISNVGYMYNEEYENKYMKTIISKYTSLAFANPPAYYYGDTATWNEETSQYVLSNSDGSDVETYTWVDNYSKLSGYYTCQSTTSLSCSSVLYVLTSSKGILFGYKLYSGKTKDEYFIKLASSITNNNDGTFTLINPLEISKPIWYENYANYKNYYYCDDLISETCDVMYYNVSTDFHHFNFYNVENIYKYGNSFIYEDGVYKLVDTKEFWNWPQNYNTLNSNHYTCFNTAGECSEMKYIYSTDSSSVRYITLSDGKGVEEAIDEMLYADDVNTTDSTIKDYIDTWYEGVILNKTDRNGALYSSYLENTIFCNNRATSNLSESGWNPNGGSTSTRLSFNFNSLECENKTDQFTLKVEAGGTEGYGNNALDYPIGLISFKEASLATGTGYLKSESNYWLISPSHISDMIYHYSISSKGVLYNLYYYGAVNRLKGVRPSVSLSNQVEIVSGNGEVDSPYQIVLITN